MIILGTV